MKQTTVTGPDDGSGIASEQDNACPAVAFEGPSYIDENGCPVPCPEDNQDSAPEGCPPPQPQQPLEQSTPPPPTPTDDIASYYPTRRRYSGVGTR